MLDDGHLVVQKAKWCSLWYMVVFFDLGFGPESMDYLQDSSICPSIHLGVSSMKYNTQWDKNPLKSAILRNLPQRLKSTFLSKIIF